MRECKFKVYDTVWVMHNNVPAKKIVFAIIQSMNYNKRGTELFLRLVDSQVGAGWGNDEGIARDISSVYATKDELIDSLRG